MVEAKPSESLKKNTTFIFSSSSSLHTLFLTNSLFPLPHQLSVSACVVTNPFLTQIRHFDSPFLYSHHFILSLSPILYAWSLSHYPSPFLSPVVFFLFLFLSLSLSFSLSLFHVQTLLFLSVFFFCFFLQSFNKSLNIVSLKVLIPINWLINPRIFM